MENQLQTLILSALIFVLPAAGAAPKRPFSHKYHLTQVASCENCHTAAAESTKATDNLMPQRSACVVCHDEVEIPPPRPIGVQKFNHALHVKMGNPAPVIASAIASGRYLGAHPPTAAELATKNTCVGCHHGIPESESVPQDKAEAADFPHMADCLVCHSKIDPPDSCAKCHVAGPEGFRPPSHTQAFVDAHATASMLKQDCAVCHGKKFTCKGCH